MTKATRNKKYWDKNKKRLLAERKRVRETNPDKAYFHQRKWHAEHRDEIAEYTRQWRKEHPDYLKTYYSDKANSLKRKVCSKTNNAIFTGKIKKQPCIICGEKAQAHHRDYNKPFDIVWLCPIHHKKIHSLKYFYIKSLNIKL